MDIRVQKFWIVLLGANISVQAQTFRFADPKADEWFADDKKIHALCGYVVQDVLREKFSLKTSVALSIAGSLLWEVRDGFWWRRFGGFSYKDFIADAFGVGLAVVKREFLFKKRKDSREKVKHRVRRLL